MYIYQIKCLNSLELSLSSTKMTTTQNQNYFWLYVGPILRGLKEQTEAGEPFINQKTSLRSISQHRNRQGIQELQIERVISR